MLKLAIKTRGLEDLIAPDSETIFAQMKSQLEQGKATPTNYDPLMGAMFAISNNAADLVKKMGGNPLYVMVRVEDEAPVVDVPGYEGRTWPYCPLCHINLGHEMFCKDPDCKLDKERAFDYWIERAADDQVKAAKELGLHVE